MEDMPIEYEDIGVIMSNFDHKIETGVEKRLKKEKVYGSYTAWNFYGIVWFGEGFFYCKILRYGSFVETITGNDLYSIMETASEKYGE